MIAIRADLFKAELACWTMKAGKPRLYLQFDSKAPDQVKVSMVYICLKSDETNLE